MSTQIERAYQRLERVQDEHAYLAYFQEQLEANCKGDLGITIQNLLELFDNGSLSLLAVDQVVFTNEDESLMDDIYKRLHNLTRVCEKPRRHLKVEQEIRNVNVVSRINHKTLRHIASHSEHWHSKTLAGLKPERLYSEVLSDDYEIYENKIVMALIRKIRMYIHEKRYELQNSLDLSAELISKSDDIGSFQDMQYYNTIGKLMGEHWEERKTVLRAQSESVQAVLDKANEIYSYIQHTDNMPMVRKLRNTPSFEGEIIKRTNILQHDTNYSKAYELWHILKENKVSDVLADTVPELDGQLVYANYCLSVFMFALSELGVEMEPDIRFEPYTAGENDFSIDFRHGNWKGELRTLSESVCDVSQYSIEMNLKYVSEAYFEIPSLVKVPDSFDKGSQRKIKIQGTRVYFLEKCTDRELDEIAAGVHYSKVPDSVESKLRTSWKSFLYNCNLKVPEVNRHSLLFNIQYINIEDTIKNIREATSELLDQSLERQKRGGYQTVYSIIPQSPSAFTKLENGRVTSQLSLRLLNYGDGYSQFDAKKYGGYKTGMIPILSLIHI